MPAEFTAKQGQYLAFIFYYRKINRVPPAQIDIQRYFEVSPPTVHQMVLSLERNGLISRTPRAARCIEVLVPQDQLPPLD
jgi:repressor LexA